VAGRKPDTKNMTFEGHSLVSTPEADSRQYDRYRTSSYRSNQMHSRSSPSAIVIGSGIVGAATAYFLAKKGVRVTLIDSSAPSPWPASVPAR
jgi:NADPH-dependent 2,4-dienoyl-CoA reductase/sulfur reductase-like enzyme